MKFITFFAAIILAATGCTQDTQTEIDTFEIDPEYSKLVATVMPVGDSNISGSVTFTETEEGVQIQGSFEGLNSGLHGFHIHQYGDCTAEDATSAGGHFDPLNNEHGAPSDMERHMGDLGNIEANEEGMATIDRVDQTVDLDQILGRGLIIHSGKDDLTTQPTGDAGSRVACGVIGIAQQQ